MWGKTRLLKEPDQRTGWAGKILRGKKTYRTIYVRQCRRKGFPPEIAMTGKDPRGLFAGVGEEVKTGRRVTSRARAEGGGIAKKKGVGRKR